jgi:acetoin utilization deacetylase AcuC-like enzyme
VAVLLGSDSRFLDHDTGPRHPECPARLAAVLRGIAAAGLDQGVVPFAPRPATRRELELVHPAEHLDALAAFCSRGGGAIDADTRAGVASWDVAVRAAGAGPDAIERLDRGEGEAAFLALRPPGHHATARQAMGFCILNNIAVAAAVLAERGERVLIVDWDVHHGNGTQAVVWADARVAYVSVHQSPLYPGTGLVEESGEGPGAGTTVNVPVPPGTTGDAFRAAVDDVVAPLAEQFRPTWVLASAGFDAHRADPLADLALSSGDFADLAQRVMALAPPGRRLAFLEGGYDLAALAASAGACVAAMAGVAYRPEPATSGATGRDSVETAARLVRERARLRSAPGPVDGTGTGR